MEDWRLQRWSRTIFQKVNNRQVLYCLNGFHFHLHVRNRTDRHEKINGEGNSYDTFENRETILNCLLLLGKQQGKWEGRVANSVTLTHMCSLHPKTCLLCCLCQRWNRWLSLRVFHIQDWQGRDTRMCFFPQAATVTWGQKRIRERGEWKKEQAAGSWRKRRIDINDFRGGRLSFSLEGRGKNFRRSPSGKRWYHVDTRARVELKGNNKNVRYCKARKKHLMTSHAKRNRWHQT